MFLVESPSQEFRVPVTRVEVELRTALQRTVVTIFLPPGGALEDLLEDDAPFFPAADGGRMRFFARASVLSIAASGVTPSEDVRPIEVRLRNGDAIAGTLTRPPRRMLDFLNEPSKTIAVFSNGKVHHVAKAHVECIEEA